MQGRRKLFILVVGLLLVVAGLVIILVVLNKSDETSEADVNTQAIEEIEQYFSENPVTSVPDQGHIDALNMFVNKSNDGAKLGQAYLNLADSYAQLSMYAESVAAYRKSLEYADDVGFDDEQVAEINSSIEAYSFLAEESIDSDVEVEQPFKEPEE